MITRRGGNTDILLITAAVAGGYFFIVKPLLQAFNLMDTREEKDAERLRAKTEGASFSTDYWNPNFINQKPSYLLTEAAARQYCAQLWNSAGLFNDDEEKIYAVFRALKYKSQVSFLAYWFAKLYKKDLYTWLRDSVLSKSELGTVLSITSKLPDGLL